MHMTHTHTLAAILFAIVSYIGGYVVWNHLFAIPDVPAGMGPSSGMSLLPLLGLFLVGYVVTYFYSLVKTPHPVMFSLIIWLLLIGTSTIPMVSIHPVPDTILIASLVDHLFTSFIGVYVIGKVLTGTTMHPLPH
jgi:peptidoglycan biosynthesis protein MviN/MurJ (putative lipid II flippase)